MDKDLDISQPTIEQKEQISETSTPEVQGYTKRNDSYIVDLGDYDWVKITPTQGVFDVEVSGARFADVDNEDMGVVRGQAYVEQYSRTRELTVEDVQAVLDPFGIKLPDSLTEKLSEWREEFWAGMEIDDPMPEERDVEIEQAGAYDAMVERMERAKLEFGSALAEAEGIAKVEAELKYERDTYAEAESFSKTASVETQQLAEGDGQSVPRFQFIEDALSAGANIDHFTMRANDSEWTVVSFKNAEGTFLLNGEDVYVTQASTEKVHASIQADPITLPGLNDLGLAGDIEIEEPDISFSKVLDSMESGNRSILEAALNGGAVVESFWSGPSGKNLEPGAMVIVSFENNPNTYLFNNTEGTAESTKLDFGATRYAVDAGYEISDLAPVHEIKGQENKVELRGEGYSLGM